MDKKDLQKLDDIGFIGTQEKKSSFLREKEMKKTGEFIKTLKEEQSKSKTRSTYVKKAS